MATKILQDGIWTWFNGPRVTVLSDGTVVPGAWPSALGRPFIGRYDAVNGTELVTCEPVAGESGYQTDDHDNPVPIELASGLILSAWSEHNGSSYCQVSTNVRNIRDWGSVVTVNSTESDSYCHLFQAGDTAETVFWFFRRLISGSTRGHFVRRAPGADPTNFNTPVNLFLNSNQRPYVLWHKTSGSRFDFCLTLGQPNEVTNSIYHGYMTIAANGALEFFKTDGTSVGLEAAAPFAPSAFTLVYSARNCWIWGINNIGGIPVIALTSFTTTSTTDDTHHYHQARWSGSAFVVDEITEGGDTGTTPHYLYASEVHYTGGIDLDPNDINRVILSKKYGSGDWRIEDSLHTGTFGSGSWAKDADISGNTGTVNARPVAVDVGGTTEAFWWEGTYTSYTSYNTSIWTTLIPTFRTAKPATPVVNDQFLPPGAELYLPLQDGSGTPADLLANYTLTAVGTPTWGSDAFGGLLSGFSTSAYYHLDAFATAFDAAQDALSYPQWFAVVFRNSNTTLTQFPFAMGRSGGGTSNNPIIGLCLNDGATGSVSFYQRNNAGDFWKSLAAGLPCNDGNIHVAVCVSTWTNRHYLIFDEALVASSETFSLGTTTLDRAAVGALRRDAVTNPFLGSVYAVLGGWGSAPIPRDLGVDLLNGRFSGLVLASGDPTATAALTTAAATMAASATFDAPVFSADAELTMAAATMAASGTFTAPEYTASAALTTAPATMEATAAFATVIYQASAALTTAPATMAASATFAEGTFTATADLNTAAATISATATFEAPSYTASADLQTAAATMEATAVFAEFLFSATAALTTSPATMSASAEFVVSGEFNLVVVSDITLYSPTVTEIALVS